MNKLVAGFKRVVDPAISLATEMSIKTVGILVDKYEDPTVPKAVQPLSGISETLEQGLNAADRNPADAENHYRLARMHHERFELTAARMEYEMAQLLSPPTGNQKFHYLLLLFHMGEIDSIYEHISLSEFDEALLQCYPEVGGK